MTKRRMVIVHILIGLFLFGSISCIVADAELWPFSNYPMYSYPYRSEFNRKLVYGVTVDGNEVRLSEGRFWWPLSEVRIANTFMRLKKLNKQDQWSSAAGYLEHLYYSRKKRKRHTGPILSGLRLYRVSWTIQPQAVNREHPDRKRLLAEVIFGE